MIIATAGHVDHGKTSLVRALTGVDTDRLEDEKRRGLTIDLGFAYIDLGGDELTGFVDVPGHDRFVRNMLAGVGAVDACWWWPPTTARCPRHANTWPFSICSAPAGRWWS